jgi:hypothetical protein
MRFLQPVFVFLVVGSTATAADFARGEGNTLWLDHGAVPRGVAVLPDGQVSTQTFRLPDCAGNFLAIEGDEPAGATTGAGAPPSRAIYGPNPAEFRSWPMGPLVAGRIRGRCPG